MPFWVHRTTFDALRSVAEADLPEPPANYVEEPDLTAVAGEPKIYWLLTGDIFSVVDQATKDAIDAAILSTQRDTTADFIDEPESYTRALAITSLGDFNGVAGKFNAILDAIDNAANFSQMKVAVAAINDAPIRTPAQYKALLRSNLEP